MTLYFILGVVLLTIGLLLKYGKIRKNYLVGYRTFRSMKNKANWEFANAPMANYSIIIGVLSTITGLIGWYLDLNSKYVIYLTMGLLIVSLIITEIRLYKFDELSQEKERGKSI